MSKAVLKDGKLQYKKFLRTRELPVEDIAWAYLQQEDVSARMCCGRADFEIGRLIMIDRNGKREILQYEGLDEPRRLLDELHEANSTIAIGYTPENCERFGVH